ncbi:MAG: DUF3108 domain-containing protein [Oxalobacter sp.]|uniref:DUF3108 domain-containing protein n=1 Tax=Oxalobacter paeniformigenes TaxID=2946594 RepID=UPI0022AE8075|nr:DUF3108 domain-containing protein [Oxalobacter paeniformigenes]MBS7405725.1 DUF3108 domain-containing protein [Oxalobacter sp.]MCZ4053681.1 DUF3108 domain-containing protein [Oxalobacter paeniformigenes]
MKKIRYVMALMTLFVISAWACAGTAADIPPSADLSYSVKAEYNGLALNGNSSIQWKASAKNYSIRNEAKVSLFGKILEADSTGRVDAQGLVPEKYTEKRLRKTQTTTLFDYVNHTVTFRADKTAPLNETVQDRASIVWQLAAVAKADPDRIVPGTTLTFPVAGSSKIEPWIFKVIKKDELTTPLGTIKTVELSRNDRKKQKMRVWLSPDHNWYPVQILFDEEGGLKLLQTIRNIAPLQ